MWFVAGFGPVAPSFGLSGRWAFSGTFSHRVPDIAENDPWYLCAGGRRAESYHRRRLHSDARNFHCSDLTSAPLLVDEFDRYQSNWTAQVCLRINLTSSSHTLHWLSLRMLVQHLRHLTHLTPQTTPLYEAKMERAKSVSQFSEREKWINFSEEASLHDLLTLLLCKFLSLLRTHLSFID